MSLEIFTAYCIEKEANKLLHAENAAQAQEIDELKARVDRLLSAIGPLLNYFHSGIHPDGGEIQFATDAEDETPAKSLSAHDAAIEEDVIERCISALGCEYDIDRNQFWWSIAIRTMPRKYNVR